MPKPCRRSVSTDIKPTDRGDVWICKLERICSADYCPRRGKSGIFGIPRTTRMIVQATKKEVEDVMGKIRKDMDNDLGQACDKERK